MAKNFITYIIESSEGKRYIGQTSNLEKRLENHNSGESFWTKRHSNWRLIYMKEFDSREEARKWENHLKKQKGGNGLKKIIKGDS